MSIWLIYTPLIPLQQTPSEASYALLRVSWKRERLGNYRATVWKVSDSDLIVSPSPLAQWKAWLPQRFSQEDGAFEKSFGSTAMKKLESQGREILKEFDCPSEPRNYQFYAELGGFRGDPSESAYTTLIDFGASSVPALGKSEEVSVLLMRLRIDLTNLHLMI